MNIKEYIIDPHMTILEAMQRLNQASARVLFITEKGRLQAAISDGDTAPGYG